jgi:hypothetical protein
MDAHTIGSESDSDSNANMDADARRTDKHSDARVDTTTIY